MRELDNADVGLREDCEEDLVDVGCNADIYLAQPCQERSTDSIHEVHACGWGMFLAFNFNEMVIDQVYMK